MIQFLHLTPPLQGVEVRSRKAKLVIGKAPDAEVSFANHPSTVVSRLHAEVRFEGDWYVLLDRSRNGTYRNGERVTGAVPLAHGDVIQLGYDGGPELQVSFVYDPALVESAAPTVTGPPVWLPPALVGCALLVMFLIGLVVLLWAGGGLLGDR